MTHQEAMLWKFLRSVFKSVSANVFLKIPSSHMLSQISFHGHKVRIFFFKSVKYIFWIQNFKSFYEYVLGQCEEMITSGSGSKGKTSNHWADKSWHQALMGPKPGLVSVGTRWCTRGGRVYKNCVIVDFIGCQSANIVKLLYQWITFYVSLPQQNKLDQNLICNFAFNSVTSRKQQL